MATENPDLKSGAVVKYNERPNASSVITSAVKLPHVSVLLTIRLDPAYSVDSRWETRSTITASFPPRSRTRTLEKKRGYSRAPETASFGQRRAEGGLRGSKAVFELSALIDGPRWRTVAINLTVVVWVVYVELVRVDAHNGSVLLVHPLDLECKLAATVVIDQVVICFVPVRQCC